MDQMQNRRIAAVKAADAINAIEVCPACFSQKAGSNGAQPCLTFIYTRMFPS